MNNIAVLVSGNGSNLQSIIDSINNGEIKNSRICAVISDRKGAYALERAKVHGINHYLVDKQKVSKLEFNEEIQNILTDEKADLIVLAGYLSIVNKELIKKYKNKIINIHPSLIPKFSGKGFYGMKVHEAVIASSCKITGVTVHFVDENVDTGPIILQEIIEVLEDDTAKTLAYRVLKLEHKCIVKAINKILFMP